MSSRGARVRHQDYGFGHVVDVLGDSAVVEFFGEQISVPLSEIAEDGPIVVPVDTEPHKRDRTLFRRALEAITLGIVPPSPEQLFLLFRLAQTNIVQTVEGWLQKAPK